MNEKIPVHQVIALVLGVVISIVSIALYKPQIESFLLTKAGGYLISGVIIMVGLSRLVLIIPQIKKLNSIQIQIEIALFVGILFFAFKWKEFLSWFKLY